MNHTLMTPPESLGGHIVWLRLWEVDDAAWYVAARDEEVFRWTTESREIDVEDVREVLRRHRAHPRWIGLAITDAGSGNLLGNIALMPLDERPGDAEISYWLAPAGRGRGAATEAVTLLVDWAFTEGAFHRIILRTKPGNERSQAVARRAGFTLQHVDEVGTQFVLTGPSLGHRLKISTDGKNS